MPIAEIGLAISALKGLSEIVESGKSLLECAQTIDKCLSLSEKAEKKLPKKKGATQKNVESSLEEFDQGDPESTNLGDIVGELEAQKKLQAALYRVGRLLDNRYGEGTWDMILKTRQDRLARRDKLEREFEAKAAAKRKAQKRFFIEIGKAILIIAVVTLFIWWLFRYY